MKNLSEVQINDIAEECDSGYFAHDDERGDIRLDFARTIEKACYANNIDFPILNIIDDYLENGASIEIRDDKVCLIRADNEVLGRGDTLQKLLTELIFILC